MIKSLNSSFFFQRSGEILVLVFSFLLLAYTSYRAANLSFTIDESISFNYLEGKSFMDIISYKHATANHHMLNALFMKYVSSVFGTSELVLRIHSLLAHVIYMFFTYKIVTQFSRSALMFTGFIILNLNPYLLDFFSLARGYAMAVSFTVVAVYFLFLHLETQKTRYSTLSIIFSVGAILSNFSSLVFYLSLILAFNVFWIRSESKFSPVNILRKNIPIGISIITLIIILFEPIRKLTTRGEFYDGGHDGFWTDTVKSLIQATFYDRPVLNHMKLVEMFIAICLIFMLIIFFYNLFTRNEDIKRVRLNSVVILLFGSGSVSIIQHYLIGSNFLINRMALFMVPIFFIGLLIMLNYFKETFLRLINSFITILIAFFCTFNTLSAYNISHTLQWQYDSDTKKAMIDLENEIGSGGEKPVSIGVMWLFEPTVNFYRQTKKFSWLEEVKSGDFRTGDFDYYFLKDSNLNFVSEMKLEIIREYKNTGSYLIRKKVNTLQDDI